MSSICLLLYQPSLLTSLSSLLSLWGGRSHQYLCLCHKQSTQHLLEGRAISGILERSADAQQAATSGSVSGSLQSIPHYWLSISRDATQSRSLWTWLNFNQPKISLSGVEAKNTWLMFGEWGFCICATTREPKQSQSIRLDCKAVILPFIISS